MAEVTRTGNPTLASTHGGNNVGAIAGLLAGEDLVAGDVVYVNTDGKVYKATGAAANAAARARGMIQVAAKAGEAVTVWREGRFGYGPKVAGVPVNPGTPLYLSGTVAGGLADAASTGGTVEIAWVVDLDGRIQLKNL